MTFWTPLFFAAVAGASTLTGIYLVLLGGKWLFRNTIYLISFTAGVLLTTSIAFLVPEAIKLTSFAPLALLLSFLAFYLLEHTIILHRHSEVEHLGHKQPHTFGLISLTGLFIHSLIDGVAIVVGFEIGFEIGILATVSVLLHELPEGISSISVLLHAGFVKSKAVAYSWLVAAATPLGAVLALIFFPQVSLATLGILLAAAAGSFLYVAASDLIPETHHKVASLNWLLVLLGVVVPFFVNYLI